MATGGWQPPYGGCGYSSNAIDEASGRSSRGALTYWPATEVRPLDRRRPVGHVEGSDVGARRDDLIDLVEDLVRERDLDAGEQVVELLHGAWPDERLHRYTEFLATKQGLAAALHSGDPAYTDLPGYFQQRLGPALGSLLDAATASGEIRAGIGARDVLHAVANLSLPVPGEGTAYSQRMVALFIDGLRYGGAASTSRS